MELRKEQKKDLKYCCEHFKCGLFFKTLKQKMNHHQKMNPECKKDSIILLKSISSS